MKIQWRRIILLICLCIGVWQNTVFVLSLIGIFPLEKWTASDRVSWITILLIGLYLFPDKRTKAEKSKYIKELGKQEKIFAIITIAMIACWGITTIFVYDSLSKTNQKLCTPPQKKN